MNADPKNSSYSRPRLKVLLVENDKEDYLITRSFLQEFESLQCQLEWVSDFESALGALKKGTHDVYLVDFRLDQGDGLELLRAGLAHGCQAPIILLTGQGGLDVDLEAMVSGAADFLVKNQLGAPLLERSIRYSLERKKTERRLQRQNKALVELAGSKTLNAGELVPALREITETTARTLEVSRISVWLAQKEGDTLECVDAFDSETGKHSQGVVMQKSAFPEYFEALEKERLLAISDALKDPRTQRISGSPASLARAGSRMDATIRWRGSMVGLVSHEQIGDSRVWAPEEQNFAGSISDLVAFTLDACERREAGQAREQLIKQLQEAMANIKTLSGLIPICASCKKIRDDSGFWNQLEAYVQTHSEARFSHGICPECEVKIYRELGEISDSS